eukprot:9469733-Pyramimonas_sp.AAC.1
MLFHVNYWNHQLAKTERARQYLDWANAKRMTEFLPLAEIDKVLDIEDGQTYVLKRVMGHVASASGE